ncbi:MAG: HupE/UreJ family protein [Planctomycetales bacterium]|nr:HupE/UreJ family protein [Planctomycetales bacterium]
MLLTREVFLRGNIFFGCLLFSCLLTRPAAAHPEGFSGMRISVAESRLRASITLHTRDLGSWFPPGRYNDYVNDVVREMELIVDDIVEIQIDGQTLPPQASHAFLLETGLIELDIDYQIPNSPDQSELLVWSKHLIYMPRGHQQLLFILDQNQPDTENNEGNVLLEEVLTVERDAGVSLLPPRQAKPQSDTNPQDLQQPIHDSDLTISTSPISNQENSEVRTPNLATSPNEPRPSRISFFALGIEHIITGYDHLLFLAALLLASRQLWEAASIITCFTVAHSVTLALAATEVVVVPAWIVEPAIAASIVYVGLDNLCEKPKPGPRIAATSFFGLIHGLGFASVLRDIGLGNLPGGIMWPLLGFNLGVEAGQLVVTGLIFAALLPLRPHERAEKMTLRAGSSLIAAIGMIWLIARISDRILTP